MRITSTFKAALTAILWTFTICHAENAIAAAPASRPANLADAARSAVKTGQLCFRISTPAETKALLGAPSKEQTENNRALTLDYPGVQATFLRFGEGAGYGLFRLVVEGTSLDIGMDRIITLRTLDDLARLDTVTGLANVSLAILDLTRQASQLSRLPFDNRTQWPPANRLPADFDPAKLLDSGKNPGLGVRKLHEDGIDGRGVHIAIIDQPLLRDHREYKDRVVEYEAIDVEGAGPQMHGSPVTSIAVGKTCGTAPAASVHFYAVPMWKWWDEHCKPYAALLDRIVKHNKDLPAGQTVRVVSISLGAFSEWPDRQLWADAVTRAAAEGILVVSCDSAELRIAILKHTLGKDPELPASYERQLFFAPADGLGVPAGNRTTAYFGGPECYIFWRDGGASWTVPYLAGLAALACQVNPEIRPQDIRELWMKTATQTPAGLVVNPPAFIDAVRNAAGKP